VRLLDWIPNPYEPATGKESPQALSGGERVARFSGGKLVLPEGESLNSLFDELAAFEEQLKPYAYELEELGL
jgi:hypothetical protein